MNYDFREIVINYERKEDAHRLVVFDRDYACTIDGPWAALNVPLTYEHKDRYFVGQALTDLLPEVFEIKFANNNVIQHLVVD